MIFHRLSELKLVTEAAQGDVERSQALLAALDPKLSEAIKSAAVAKQALQELPSLSAAQEEQKKIAEARATAEAKLQEAETALHIAEVG